MCGLYDKLRIYPRCAAYSDNGGYVTVQASDVSSELTDETVRYGYVNSTDPNAYPINDGYTYVSVGQLGEKTRIATGSYVGTGGRNKFIDLGFTPKVVLLAAYWQHSQKVGFLFDTTHIYICADEVGVSSNGTYDPYITNNGFVVGVGSTWYNESGQTARYVAIG